MSESIPESIPTSADPRSKRPIKRRALTPVSEQASTISALFARPDQEINIPAPGGLGKSGSRISAPPEIVANVQGSSAGAGSGEFHVYKAGRRREYARVKGMEDDLRREEEGKEFEREKMEREEKDDEKTRKNRERREKVKARKNKARKGVAVDSTAASGNGQSIPSATGGGIKSRANVRTREAQDDGVTDVVMGIEGAEEVGIIIHDDD